MREFFMGVLVRYYWTNKSYNCEPERVLVKSEMNISSFYNNYGMRMFCMENENTVGTCSYPDLFRGFEDFANKQIYESY